MDSIYRISKDKLVDFFTAPSTLNRPKGLILAGMVGVGKTTVIQQCLKQLEAEVMSQSEQSRYELFEFSGDDVQFRQAVKKNSRFIWDEIQSKTQGRTLVFVDEVQKCEEVFDALKICFDHGVSFIVSGSNPAYLSSVAKKRLQRRGEFWILQTLSLPEILLHEKCIEREDLNLFAKVLLNRMPHIPLKLSAPLNSKVHEVCRRYLSVGGLPLAQLAPTQTLALQEVRKVVERGFELFKVVDEGLAETIEVELSKLHSQEFSYQGIMNRTGIRKRDPINQAIDELIHHGYLVRKKPYLTEDDRRSYLSVYSYTDPGVVTYLSGMPCVETNLGSRVEGMIHSRLWHGCNEQPLKTHLHYFKKYTVDSAGKTKFAAAGEIDFLIEQGSWLLPVEVKSTAQLTQIDTSTMDEFIAFHKLKFGIVLYGGLPVWRKEKKILFFPYWLV
jgi:predicted AAA+ superfamily ATPase